MYHTLNILFIKLTIIIILINYVIIEKLYNNERYNLYIISIEIGQFYFPDTFSIDCTTYCVFLALNWWCLWLPSHYWHPFTSKFIVASHFVAYNIEIRKSWSTGLYPRTVWQLLTKGRRSNRATLVSGFEVDRNRKRIERQRALGSAKDIGVSYYRRIRSYCVVLQRDFMTVRWSFFELF